MSPSPEGMQIEVKLRLGVDRNQMSNISMFGDDDVLLKTAPLTSSPKEKQSISKPNILLPKPKPIINRLQKQKDFKQQQAALDDKQTIEQMS